MEKFVIRVLLTLPVMYIAMQGLQSLGFGSFAQIALSVVALTVYDFGQKVSNS